MSISEEGWALCLASVDIQIPALKARAGAFVCLIIPLWNLLHADAVTHTLSASGRVIVADAQVVAGGLGGRPLDARPHCGRNAKCSTWVLASE